VRKSDVSIVKDCIPGAIKRYKEIMLKEVGVLAGKKPEDIPCTITMDETNFLHEWNKED
jgi:hypothetical protein